MLQKTGEIWSISTGCQAANSVSAPFEVVSEQNANRLLNIGERMGFSAIGSGSRDDRFRRHYYIFCIAMSTERVRRHCTTSYRALRKMVATCWTHRWEIRPVLQQFVNGRHLISFVQHEFRFRALKPLNQLPKISIADYVNRMIPCQIWWNPLSIHGGLGKSLCDFVFFFWGSRTGLSGPLNGFHI